MTAAVEAMQAGPVRLQRSRAKGVRLTSPNGLPVVCVSRGTKWGNPFRIFGQNEYLYCDASHRRKIFTPWVIWDHDQEIGSNPATPTMAVELYRRWLAGEFNADGIVRPCNVDTAELRGKNLACWCSLEKPCHADVLLEIANAPVAALRAVRAAGGSKA